MSVPFPLPTLASPEEETSYTIKVSNDYYCFFETWLRAQLDSKLKSGRKLRRNEFHIDAGPYKACSVSWKIPDNKPKRMDIEFYSVCRYNGGPEHNEHFIDML